MRAAALVVFVLVLSLAGTASAGVLQKVQRSLSKVNSLRGEFIQKNYYTQLDETFRYRGEFVLKRPDRLKWTYTEGSRDMIFVNGREATLIQPDQKQAIVQEVDRFGITRAPVLFLFNEKLLTEQFRLVKEDSTEVVLEPRDASMGLKRLVMDIVLSEKFPIRSIFFEDLYGNTIEVRFVSIKINPKITDRAFRFSIPEDYTLLRPQFN